MPTVRCNGMVEALVHNGGNWFSMATLPDVCKTPTPSGPMPMPYPNISYTNSLSGGTTTVKIDGGSMAGIKGSKFAMSTGDEPGTLGGIKSSTFKQASTWLLYSFDIKLEGKNACRFSDKKFQNNENTVDAAGVLPIVVMVAVDEVRMKCGELNQYGEQKKDTSQKGKMHRDHVPSKGALKAKAAEMLDTPVGMLSGCVRDGIETAALSIVLPAPMHRRTRSYGQSQAKASKDAEDLQDAAKKDLAKVENMKFRDKACEQAYKKAAKKIEKITNRQYKAWLRKIIKGCGGC